MANQKQVRELKEQLRKMKAQQAQEKQILIAEWEIKINKLISGTPTGDLRNTFTELNILFLTLAEY